MRKIVIFILAVVMVLSVAACGNGDGDLRAELERLEEENRLLREGDSEPTTEPEAVQEPEPISEPEPEIEEEEPEPVVMDESSDLIVVLAYVFNNSAYILVENTSDTAILNYRVAFTGFDRNGFPATRNKYNHGNVERANILPGERFMASFRETEAHYVVATVIGIDFHGGESWEMPVVSMWADEVIDSFTPEFFTDKIERLTPYALMAESNDYLALVSTDLVSRNRFSDSNDFDFVVSNTTDQSILSVWVLVLQFDSNGYPVSSRPWNHYVQNDRFTGGNINLATGETGSFTDNLFFSGETELFRVLIWSMEFSDGEDWINPYAYEWILVNADRFKG